MRRPEEFHRKITEFASNDPRSRSEHSFLLLADDLIGTGMQSLSRRSSSIALARHHDKVWRAGMSADLRRGIGQIFVSEQGSLSTQVHRFTFKVNDETSLREQTARELADIFRTAELKDVHMVAP